MSEDIRQHEQNQFNLRSELRFYLELTSYVSLFFAFALLLFSVAGKTADIRTNQMPIPFIHWHITIPGIWFFLFGIFSSLVTLFFITILFRPSWAKKVSNWVEQPNPAADNKIMAPWMVIFAAVMLTFLTSLIDTVGKLPNNIQGVVAWIGLIILVIIPLRWYAIFLNSLRKPPKAPQKYWIAPSLQKFPLN
jgi:hypothetical protein